MNQKSTNILLLAILFCLSISLAFFNFSISNAQTSEKEKPNPTVTPEPTIEDEDGEIIINEELVNLNVRVVDRNNRPISTLGQNDFQIFEDKIPQTISYFSKSEVPTNYALVIDNSGSLRFQLEKVIEASKVIVNTNKPDDATGVIRFVSSDKIEILSSPEFTNDKEELFDALDNMYIEGGQTSIIDAIYLAAEKVDEYEKTNDSNDRRRRALILISDGEDRASFYKEEQLFDLLKESDVQIYAIGFVNDLEKDGSFIRKSPQKKAKEFLERLATETGGKAYFPNNLPELDGIARDIASELRTQYLISYTPTNDRKDGTFRNIKIVVKDGPKNEKRIAISRTGRTAEKSQENPPILQKKNN